LGAVLEGIRGGEEFRDIEVGIVGGAVGFFEGFAQGNALSLVVGLEEAFAALISFSLPIHCAE
jgi:hypothetical protein